MLSVTIYLEKGDRMNKKFLVGSIAGFLLVVISLYFYAVDDGNTNLVKFNEDSKQTLNSNAITMMYETGADSGEYQVSSDTTWPQDGYVFNERLSGCENGSTLTWDDENKKVLMQANTSDKCYVYFDVYTGISIAYSEGTPTTYLYLSLIHISEPTRH